MGVGCANRAAKNHKAAAASEAHVPGPGAIRPIPKKVPAAHAHPVFVPVFSLVPGVVIVLVTPDGVRIQSLKHFGVEYG